MDCPDHTTAEFLKSHPRKFFAQIKNKLVPVKFKDNRPLVKRDDLPWAVCAEIGDPDGNTEQYLYKNGFVKLSDERNNRLFGWVGFNAYFEYPCVYSQRYKALREVKRLLKGVKKVREIDDRISQMEINYPPIEGVKITPRGCTIYFKRVN